ncbi:MAG TPA: cation:proton antiporter [Gemmatimonadaceae bacterium]|nr:cation:proton antiporter [Gemmatimonadaceae bacterium]
MTDRWQWLREYALSLPLLAKFAIGLALIVVVPSLSRRLRIPAVVGLLVAGVLFGPYGLDVIGKNRPIAGFFAELGKLLLMFMAGLEVDLALFRRVKTRSISFGAITTFIPLLLGMAVGLIFGYAAVAAVVIGSLLASHTLLASSVVSRLGLTRLEPITVVYGATVFSDTCSLIVFAICVSTFQRGFSISGISIQLLEIAAFVLFVLFGLSRVGAYVLAKVEKDESAYFAVMVAILAVAAVLAEAIQLPGIVGAFLSGLALNAATQGKPAKEELRFVGNTLFIPIFFITTGFLINPRSLVDSLRSDFPLVAAIIGVLVVGKYIAAEIAGRRFHYTRDERLTIWSLTLPQVAATLAATLVAFDTFDASHQRLIDSGMLNVVLTLMLFTSIVGPILTERFAPRLVPKPTDERAKLAA